MDGPQQSRGKRQSRRRGTELRRQLRQKQSPPYQTEQRQRCKDVNGQIDSMVALDCQPTDGIVNGERKVHDWPPRGRDRIRRRRQDLRRSKLANGLVLDNRRGIVEDKRTVEAVRVGRAYRDNEECRSEEHTSELQSPCNL